MASMPKKEKYQSHYQSRFAGGLQLNYNVVTNDEPRDLPKNNSRGGLSYETNSKKNHLPKPRVASTTILLHSVQITGTGTKKKRGQISKPWL